MDRVRIWAAALLTALATLAGPTATRAAVIEVGDAGQTLATAQDVTGETFPFEIQGEVISLADVDLYKFTATGGVFSATTLGGITVFDTQLFLFDATGRGIVANDNLSGSSTRSAITATLTAGVYYLGVSGFDNEPFSTGGAIFPNDKVGLLSPTGPGGSLPLFEWQQQAGRGEGSAGVYSIFLTLDATGPNPVPAPAGVVLMGIGMGCFGLTRLRRRPSA